MGTISSGGRSHRRPIRNIRQRRPERQPCKFQRTARRPQLLHRIRRACCARLRGRGADGHSPPGTVVAGNPRRLRDADRPVPGGEFHRQRNSRQQRRAGVFGTFHRRAPFADRTPTIHPVPPASFSPKI